MKGINNMFWWQEEGKIEVFIQSKRYLIKKSELVKYLEKQTAKCTVKESFLTILNKTEQTGPVMRVMDRNGQYSLRNRTIYQREKAIYHNVLHFILCNMKHTVKIWVYDDGAVRLYQEDEVSSIWWDTPSCYMHPLNLYLLDKFIEFVKQYK